MPNYLKLSDNIGSAMKRYWAGQHFLVEQAAAELEDVETLLDELDEHYEALDRMQARVHHAVRRLQQKTGTTIQMDASSRHRWLNEDTRH